MSQSFRRSRAAEIKLSAAAFVVATWLSVSRSRFLTARRYSFWVETSSGLYTLKSGSPFRTVLPT